MLLDALHLRETQSQVPSRAEAAHGDARLVDGEGLVVDDGEVEGLEVVEGVRPGGPGGFPVVQGDDEAVVEVGESAVPFVIVVGDTDGETASVDCEEGREGLRGGLVVVRGEEDAADGCQLCLGFVTCAERKTYRTGSAFLQSYCLMRSGRMAGGQKYDFHASKPAF